jgi:hypothetical protein
MVGITSAGILATFIVAWFTYRANREAGKGRVEAERAHTEALKASATASQGASRSAEQQVQVLTLLVDRLNQGPVSTDAPPPTDVQWHLSRDIDKGRWLIRNTGTATAHDATIAGLTEADREDLYIPYDEPLDIPPVGLIEFGIERSLASAPATVIVASWTDDLGQERTHKFVVT